MLYSVLSLALFSALASAALVPQVQLCDRPECPWVSRLGMGTLHLADSISGISNPQIANAWIRKAVSLGITLFDLADVSSHPIFFRLLLCYSLVYSNNRSTP
jgi:hypothetical protein